MGYNVPGLSLQPCKGLGHQMQTTRRALEAAEKGLKLAKLRQEFAVGGSGKHPGRRGFDPRTI
jgi:hypothetical protein